MSAPTAIPNTFFLVLRRLRIPLVILISAYAISVLGFVLIPGTLADGNSWRMDFFHAFYFVSYMGSTIGFGELPHPFSGAQRLWTLFTIYATVISWLYAIGTMISLLQDRSFIQAVARTRANNRIRKRKEPFYLVCGFGESGKVVTRFLTQVGEHCVVIDRSDVTINELKLENLPLDTIGLCADASDPEELMSAGLTHRLCKGVVAVIGDDQENLKIAISAKLLNPGLKVIGRVNDNDTADNMRSFGTDHAINPFTIFGWHFSLAFTSPGLHLLNDWLSQTDYQELHEPVFPPRGKWILCGYGRFGKTLDKDLQKQGNSIVVIEAEPENTGAPDNCIRGRGTEAKTLRQAGIDTAVGIIAGTNYDANNLSILMTAKEENPGLFTVARQNQNRNASLFRTAQVDVVADQNVLIANRVINLLTTPLTTEFLYRANKQDSEWSNELVSRISATVEDNAPITWVVTLDFVEAPAFMQTLREGFEPLLKHIYREPHNRKVRLPCVPLMVIHQGEFVLAPVESLKLEAGDKVLFCGQREAGRKIAFSVSNINLMNYLVTGKHRAINPLWRWLTNDSSNRGNKP